MSFDERSPTPTFDYTGHRFLLAHSETQFEIWDRLLKETPAEVFPKSAEGWAAAWNRFTGLEPNAIPVQAPEMTISGEFKKQRLLPNKGFGKFRGSGSVSITPEGLRVSGKHIYPTNTRVLIILGTLGVSVAIFFLTKTLIIPGFILLYVLVEYVFLTHSDLAVPWEGLQGFVVDEKAGAVSIAMDAPDHQSTAVVKAPGWQALAHGLRSYAGGKESELEKPKTSKGLLIALGVIILAVFIAFLVAAIMTSPG